jgi:hypothetical protein
MDIIELIKKYGIENLYFFTKFKPLRTIFCIAYTSSKDPDINLLSKINCDKFDPFDEYKITLEPINMNGRFAKNNFYLNDFRQMIKDGEIKIMLDISKD